MSFFADSMVNYAPSGSQHGLIVRPIGTGPSGSIKVTSDPNNPMQVTGSVSTSLSGTIDVTGSVEAHIPGVVTVTGSVYVLNPTSFSGTLSFTPVLDNSLEGIVSSRKTVRYDFPTLASSPIYVGYAPLGSDESAAVWTIKKISNDANGNPTAEEWSSSGSAVWNSRTIEAYT